MVRMQTCNHTTRPTNPKMGNKGTSPEGLVLTALPMPYSPMPYRPVASLGLQLAFTYSPEAWLARRGSSGAHLAAARLGNHPTAATWQQGQRLSKDWARLQDKADP